MHITNQSLIYHFFFLPKSNKPIAYLTCLSHNYNKTKIDENVMITITKVIKFLLAIPHFLSVTKILF